MPKKRKTRKEKIHKDIMRQEVHETTPSVSSSQNDHQEQPVQETTPAAMTFSLPTVHSDGNHTQPARTQKITNVAISTEEYNYLGNDLSKTALLSSAIVIAELLIRLFYNH
jgi:hypothetical protein